MPVHIRVPINVFHEEAEVNDLYAESEYSRYPAHRPVADHGRMRAAIDVLLSARMPVIACGQGALIYRATEAVLELGEMLQIPVATTTPSKGTIPENHPLALRVISPYAADVRMATGLPVFSIYSFVHWFHQALVPDSFPLTLDDPRHL